MAPNGISRLFGFDDMDRFAAGDVELTGVADDGTVDDGTTPDEDAVDAGVEATVGCDPFVTGTAVDGEEEVTTGLFVVEEAVTNDDGEADVETGRGDDEDVVDEDETIGTGVVTDTGTDELEAGIEDDVGADVTGDDSGVGDVETTGSELVLIGGDGVVPLNLTISSGDRVLLFELKYLSICILLLNKCRTRLFKTRSVSSKRGNPLMAGTNGDDRLTG